MMGDFTIATFNMQFGQVWDARAPDDAPRDLEQTIAAIVELDADVVLLQEVEAVAPERGQLDPPPNFTRIRRALPRYHATFAYPVPDAAELPFGYGQAILCREPLFGQMSIDLPAPVLSFEFRGRTCRPTKRLMLAARTRLAGAEIQLFNAHLQAFFIINESSNAFREQRDEVERHLRASRLPTLLGGDMNSAPGEDLVGQFEAAGFRAVQTAEVTWKRRPYTLDHIFYNDAFEVLEYAVVPTDAADHEILWARMRVRQAEDA